MTTLMARGSRGSPGGPYCTPTAQPGADAVGWPRGHSWPGGGDGVQSLLGQRQPAPAHTTASPASSLCGAALMLPKMLPARSHNRNRATTDFFIIDFF